MKEDDVIEKWKKKNKAKTKLIKNEIAVDFAVYSLYNVLMSNVENKYTCRKKFLKSC